MLGIFTDSQKSHHLSSGQGDWLFIAVNLLSVGIGGNDTKQERILGCIFVDHILGGKNLISSLEWARLSSSLIK